MPIAVYIYFHLLRIIIIVLLEVHCDSIFVLKHFLEVYYNLEPGTEKNICTLSIKARNVYVKEACCWSNCICL